MSFLVSSEEYFDYAHKLESLYDDIRHQSCFSNLDNLFIQRKYTKSCQRDYIRALGVGYVDPSYWRRGMQELGLEDKRGDFQLAGRFLIPVRDVTGNMLTMIGWSPRGTKYMTCHTRYFKKAISFFGMDFALKASQSYGGCAVVVEGMFDCISLQSLGLPALATMGSAVGQVKCVQLSALFNKVVGLPDGDKVGQDSLPKGKSPWVLPSNATFLSLNLKGVKDADDLVTFCDADAVRRCLTMCMSSTKQVEYLHTKPVRAETLYPWFSS